MSKTLCFWLTHKVDHYKSLLGFFVTGFLYLQRLHRFCTPFFSSVTRRQESEWMSKHCQKLKCEVKEFCQINKLFSSKLICRYTFHNVAFGHFIPSTVLFTLQITLNLSPLCSLLSSFTTLPPHLKSYLSNSSSQSSANKARFIKFCKLLSTYLLFIRRVQEKQFC